MKFSSQEEYGLRCILHLARLPEGSSMTIQEISSAEGISSAHTAKILRILRKAGYLSSARGQAGGYALSAPADEIALSGVLAALGGKLFEEDFCDRYSSESVLCTKSTDCTIRSLWQTVQHAVDNVLDDLTLADLTGTELPQTSKPKETSSTAVV